MVANFLAGIVTAFRILWKLCLWIGWVNTTIILSAVKAVVWVAKNSVSGLVVLGEDLLTFLEEVGEAVDCLASGLVDSLASVVGGICWLSSAVFSGLVAAPTAVLNSMMSFKLGTHLISLIVLLRDGVLFLGICFWEVFALVYVAVNYLNEAPYIIVLLLARIVDSTISSLLSSLQTYAFRSLCGLAMAYGTYVLAKNAGILPDLDFATIIFSGFLRCRLGVKRAVRMLRVSIIFLLALLKSVTLTLRRFLARQATAVKDISWEIYREFVSYTPTKAALKIKLEQEKASNQCVVCMDRKRDVMILSCRHLLMCRSCALTVAVQSGDCPVCRTPIDNIISVYT